MAYTIKEPCMKFNQTPHPTIEDHYHIQELINSQEKRSEDRGRHQQIERQRDLAQKDIKGFKDVELLDFWCDRCHKDFVGRARKQVDNWSPKAYYKIKHTCGKWCIRHITDRILDRYFFKSVKVAIDRGKAFGDMLQPFQSGYNTLYKKQ